MILGSRHSVRWARRMRFESTRYSLIHRMCDTHKQIIEDSEVSVCHATFYAIENEPVYEDVRDNIECDACPQYLFGQTFVQWRYMADLLIPMTDQAVIYEGHNGDIACLPNGEKHSTTILRSIEHTRGSLPPPVWRNASGKIYLFSDLLEWRATHPRKSCITCDKFHCNFMDWHHEDGLCHACHYHVLDLVDEWKAAIQHNDAKAINGLLDRTKWALRQKGTHLKYFQLAYKRLEQET